MKRKVVLSVVGLAGLLLAVVWFVDREFTGAPNAEVVSQEQPADTNPVETIAPVVSTEIAALSNSLPKPDPAREAAKLREARIEHLEELSMNDDPGSLSTILLELENPEKEIRAAALEAAIQYGERSNTIAKLKQLESRTEDFQERAAIHDAIEYIALPSLSEVLAQRKADPNRPKATRRTSVSKTASEKRLPPANPLTAPSTTPREK